MSIGDPFDARVRAVPVSFDGPPLIGFLLDRLAEEEREARAANQLPWMVAEKGMAVVTPTGFKIAPRIQRRADKEHIARYSPSRILAECEAKRRIILDCLARIQDQSDDPQVIGGWMEQFALETLWSLAFPYSNHPEFNDEWHP